jgi:hypothetical protein
LHHDRRMLDAATANHHRTDGKIRGDRSPSSAAVGRPPLGAGVSAVCLSTAHEPRLLRLDGREPCGSP